MADATGSTTHEALLERVAALEAALEAERAALAVERSRADAAAVERDRLREAYRHLQLEVELMRRRLVVAKAERIDTAQLQLEFAAKLAALDALGGQLTPVPDDEGPTAPGKTRSKDKHRGTGRRDLRDLTLPEERIEISDPALEGTAPRIGTEDSTR